MQSGLLFSIEKDSESEADGELEVDAPRRQVVGDGVAPSGDVLNPRVVNGVADAKKVEDLEGDKAFKGFRAFRTTPLDSSALSKEEVARKADVDPSVGR